MDGQVFIFKTCCWDTKVTVLDYLALWEVCRLQKRQPLSALLLSSNSASKSIEIACTLNLVIVKK